MTIEQKAMMLKMACDLITDAGFSRITACQDNGVRIQTACDFNLFKSLPGEVTILERNCDKFPYELSKEVCGCKFFIVAASSELAYMANQIPAQAGLNQ